MCLPKIYTAGKIWHADKFRMLRDELHFNINARWIDYKDDSDLVMNRKDELWQHCYEDVRDCDAVLLYSKHPREEQRGALVELGMAYGMNKPVFAVGKCRSIKPDPVSDVAFTHHHLWRWMEDDLVTAAYKITLITAYAKKAA
jgi:nucleoside 2-deoxyribosyltransferase